MKIIMIKIKYDYYEEFSNHAAEMKDTGFECSSVSQDLSTGEITVTYKRTK